jgi:hypothetical protein
MEKMMDSFLSATRPRNRPLHRRILSALIITLFLCTVVISPDLSTRAGAEEPDAVPYTFFPAAPNVLALFEFEGTVDDISGNNRDATVLGGSLVDTTCGTGFAVNENSHGLDWSTYTTTLTHPYTIEMIVTPDQTSGYAKLFSGNQAEDRGWYYVSQGIRVYPVSLFAQGTVLPHERHYIAFVSTAADTVDIYFQGSLLGTSGASFTAPPASAVFFQDDTATSRVEALDGVVDALRISSVARTKTEIATVQQRVFDCIPQKVFLPAALND